MFEIEKSLNIFCKLIIYIDQQYLSIRCNICDRDNIGYTCRLLNVTVLVQEMSYTYLSRTQMNFDCVENIEINPFLSIVTAQKVCS